MKLSFKYCVGLQYAYQWHKDQIRKDSNIPYMSHLLSVSALVMEYGGNEDQAIAALLHDSIEDSKDPQLVADTILDQFGLTVAEIVRECTDSFSKPKPPWQERKEQYLKTLPNKREDTLLVVMCDKLHNLRCIIMDYQQVGMKVFDRFVAKKEGTLWYYRTLGIVFKDISKQYPQLEPIVDEYVDNLYKLNKCG